MAVDPVEAGRMKGTHVLGVVLVLVSLLVLAACNISLYARPATGQKQPYPYGPGGGMMGGSWGYNYGRNANPNVKPITIDQAANSTQRYMNGYGGNLVLAEVMNFELNYYAEVKEKKTGIHAMELLIDKYTGGVSPEIGPNMMWNAKYSPMGGMMGNFGRGRPTTDMPVTPERAETLAQQYLDANVPGLTVAEADKFYGYYTLHTLKNGQVDGMLSVNGYSGAIWYHSWHGSFIDMKEFE